MQHRLLRLLMMVAVLVALGESTARANSVDFSYSWSMQPSTVLTGSTGSVQFALSPAGTGNYVMGAASPTLLSGAQLTSTVAPGATDTYNVPYSLKLSLTDTASSTSGSLTFGGTLAGSLSSTMSTLTSTFSSPLTQNLLLGSHLYQVTIDPTILAVPKPGSSANALLDALVVVKNMNGGDGSPQVPEPSSLVLGGIAVFGMAARRWSRAKSGKS